MKANMASIDRIVRVGLAVLVGIFVFLQDKLVGFWRLYWALSRSCF